MIITGMKLSNHWKIAIIICSPVCIIFLILWMMVDASSGISIAKKCAPELNKKPPETRDLAKIDEEVKNFDSCLNSMTRWDYIRYGLLP